MLRAVFFIQAFLLASPAKSQYNYITKNRIILNIKKAPRDNVFITFYDLDTFDNVYTLTSTDKENVPFILDTIQISHPVIMFNSNQKLVPYLIYPSEKIEILPKGNSIQLNIKGDSIRNNELNFFPELLSSFPDISVAKIPSEVMKILNSGDTFDHLMSRLDSARNLRILFLKNYKQKNAISNSFEFFCLGYFKYSNLYDKIAFLFKYNKDEPLVKNQLLEFKKDFNNDSLLNYKFYKNALSRYLEIMLHKSGSDKTLEGSVNFIDTFFANQSRDYLLYKYLSKNIPLLKINTASDSIINKIHSSDLAEKIRESIKPNDFSLVNTNLILDKNGSRKTFEEIVKHYRGSYLFIDFWASWCIPCINEFSNSKNLELLYKDKPLKFLYISVDKNPNDWLRFTNKRKDILNDSTSFFLINGFESPLFNRYKITTIPRYFILDKEGIILTTSASRPSDISLKIFLDKLLK